MSNGELTHPRSDAWLPALPNDLPPLSSLEGKRALLNRWIDDKALVPGVIRGKNADPRAFAREGDQLAERRNSILVPALLSNLSHLLNQADFCGALDRTARQLAECPLRVPPGLDLVGSLEDNEDWIGVLHAKLAFAVRGKASADKLGSGLVKNASVGAPSPVRWLSEVRKPLAGDRADFLRWWNQSIAIKALATITAGIRSWHGLVEDLCDGEYGPLGRRSHWSKSDALIPTGQTSEGRNVHIRLHAHPEVCELLAFGREADKRGSDTWAVEFAVRNLSGSSSQGTYRTATGLKVSHLYLVTLLEHLRTAHQPVLWKQLGKQRALMSSPSRTEAAEVARKTAIQQLMHAEQGEARASGTAMKTARRFGPPESSTLTMHRTNADGVTQARSVTLDELSFVPADSANGQGGSWSIGGILLDPVVLNPEHGLSLIRLYATVARQGLHQLSVELRDDEDDPLRVHLIAGDLTTLPGVTTADDEIEFVRLLRQAMKHAQWAFAVEPSYPAVANLGLAIAISQ